MPHSVRAQWGRFGAKGTCKQTFFPSFEAADSALYKQARFHSSFHAPRSLCSRGLPPAPLQGEERLRLPGRLPRADGPRADDERGAERPQRRVPPACFTQHSGVRSILTPTRPRTAAEKREEAAAARTRKKDAKALGGAAGGGGECAHSPFRPAAHHTRAHQSSFPLTHPRLRPSQTRRMTRRRRRPSPRRRRRRPRRRSRRRSRRRCGDEG